MSTKRDELKTYFETGDRPTEEEFEKLIDSGINQEDDQVYVSGTGSSNPSLGIGVRTATQKLHVNGNVQLDGSLLIKGDIVGDSSDKGANDVTIIKNNGQIQFFGKNHPTRGGDVYVLPDKESGSGKLVVGQRLGGGQWRDNLRENVDGDLAAGYQKQDFKVEFGAHFRQVTLGSSAGKSTGYGTGYLGFNATRNHDAENWSIKSDNSHNGAAIVSGDIMGNLYFKTFESDKTGLGGKYEKNISNGDFGNHTRMTIKGNGNVGVGTKNPGNKLEILGLGDTGLKLPTGASDGYVLVSKNGGNATWERPEALTDGLWVDKGNGDIENGNQRHVLIDTSVGIGSASPNSKLDIVGKVGDEATQGIVKIIGNDGSGKDLRFGVNGPSNQYAWIQSHGNVPLKINSHGHGNDVIINQHAGNVGIGVVSPGYKLDVGGTSNFRGEIKVNNKTPIVMRRFNNLGDISGGYRLTDGGGNPFTQSDYSVAAFVGMYTSEGEIAGGNKFHMRAYTTVRSGVWYAVADWRSINADPEGWSVTIMFVRNEISKWI